MMKVLVDSGSTKADWIAINAEGKIVFETATLGLNPEVLTKEEILERLINNKTIEKHKGEVTEFYFYGAGCGTNRMKDFLHNLFSQYFKNAKIEVYEDTYAAVYATTKQNEQAIVCILGTGSNCSYFDGTKVHQKVQSLGYIAMDDCSGNRFGRALIRGYYFNAMPKELALQFEKEYNLDADVIKSNLYKEPNPNAYLARFAKFLIQHKNSAFCQEIIFSEIEKFIKFYIKQFENYKEIPVHFIGSIAFYLREELTIALEKHQIQLGKILIKPIDGLIDFHKNNG